MSESYVSGMNHNCAPLSELFALETEINSAGVYCLYGRLEPDNLDMASMSLACNIARRRLKNNRYLEPWHLRMTGEIDDIVGETEAQVIQTALLENFGTPDAPADHSHLLGLVAEGIWQGVVTDVDIGLGTPISVETNGWSVTDAGGDGLTIFNANGGFHYRLWESKYHGANGPLRETVNGACRQVDEKALSYLTRFSAVAQNVADGELAAFYGRLAELWVDKSPAAGVGIVVAADRSYEDRSNDCFDRMIGYFELPPQQHQGNLNLVDGFRRFAESVRRYLWKGCGLWTAR